MKQFKGSLFLFIFVIGLTLSLSTESAVIAQGTAAKQVAKQQADKYPTVAMRGGKLSQDKSSGVVYFDAKQREERRITFQNGLVYDHAGNPILNSKSKHQNHWNYVMDGAGNFYLFDEFTHPEIRHSSIFAGGPVAGGGNIQIVNGRVVYIDADSGHYSTKGVLGNVHKELAAQGVTIGGAAEVKESKSSTESRGAKVASTEPKAVSATEANAASTSTEEKPGKSGKSGKSGKQGKKHKAIEANGAAVQSNASAEPVTAASTSTSTSTTAVEKEGKKGKKNKKKGKKNKDAQTTSPTTP